MKRNLVSAFLLLFTLSIAAPLQKRAFSACSIGNIIDTEVFPNPPVPTGVVTFSVAGKFPTTIPDDARTLAADRRRLSSRARDAGPRARGISQPLLCRGFATEARDRNPDRPGGARRAR